MLPTRRQHLDLLQPGADRAAQLRAHAAQVVWREPGMPILAAYSRSIWQTTFSPRRSPVSPAAADHRPEDMTLGEPGRPGPGIDRHLHPARHRRRAYPAVLADEIDDAPAALPLLDVRERERGDFGPTDNFEELDINEMHLKLIRIK